MDMDMDLERLMKDMKRVVANAEALLEAGGDKLGETRGAVVERLETARDRLADLERTMARGIRRTARRVDYYARDNPWQITGVALAVGVIIGTVLGLAAGARRD